MKMVGSTAGSTAGIILRASNYASSSSDNYTSIQGYYIYVNNNIICAQKLNYAYSSILKMAASTTESDSYFNLKIVARGNNIKTYKNNILITEFNDEMAFTAGRLGLYTNGAAVIYKNLSITA
jgi:hypothetical protein